MPTAPLTGTPETCFHRPVREDFPVLERLIDGHPVVYLDSAATSLKPRSVIDAVGSYYSRCSANIHRGKHYLSEEASEQYELGRYRVAQLVGCFGNEVVFTKNTTEAINLVATGLCLSHSDLVVTTLDAHHSQQLPWRRTAKVAITRADARGCVDLEHYAELLRLKPKVVALTHCSNVTGAYAPVEEMTRRAKETGALTLIDVAQSIGHRQVNFEDVGADFLAFSSHKMLGPSGVGVLIARQGALANLQPLCVGGGTVDWVDRESFRLRKIPHCFEAGTPNIEGVLGFVAALDYLNELGFDAIEKHDRYLGDAMTRLASQRPYLEVIGPGGDNRAAILTIWLRGVADLATVARSLSDTYGVMCRSGHLCAQPLVDSFCAGEVLRASAYLYNTVQDVETFFNALDEIHATLRPA